jgi:hypothetical protein
MADPNTDQSFDGAKLLGSGLAVVSAITGLIGGFTGAVPRLIRNHPGIFELTIILALAAVLIAFAASSVEAKGPGQWIRLGLEAVAIVVFVATALVLVSGLTDSLTSGDQPRLSATWSFPTGEQPILTVHMQLDDLKSAQTVYISVIPQGGSSDDAVFRSQTGADVDGNADMTFDVTLPPGDPGLDVVASVGTPATCDGNRIPALIPATATSAAAMNTTVSAAPTESSTRSAQPPVKSTSHAPLNFSCIQINEPLPAAATASPSPSSSPS